MSTATALTAYTGMQTGRTGAPGRAITDLAHLRQSVADILTTPIGTRVMRRPYGSLIPRLIDQPATPANVLRIKAAAVDALTRWEPRVRAQQIDTDIQADGRLLLAVLLRRNADGREFRTEIPL